jgi:hypothetical protein
MELEEGLTELLAWVRASTAGDHVAKSLEELESRGLVR